MFARFNNVKATERTAISLSCLSPFLENIERTYEVMGKSYF